MTGLFSVTAGAVVRAKDGKAHMVRKFETPTTVVARCLETGLDAVFKLSDLKPLEETPLMRQDLSLVDEEKFELAYQRFKVLEGLARKRKNNVTDIDEAAQQMSCSRATAYRLLKRYRTSKVVTGLMRKRRSDVGATRLSATAEILVKQVINEYWLTEQKPSIQRAWKELRAHCKREGEEPPSYNTLRARILSLNPADTTKKREGRNAALRYSVNEGTVPYATHPYALLQIDHTPLDVVVVDDDTRQPIGRPWITVAIDVYSRMVAGYYLSLDPPGTLGTGICIATAILAKDPILVRLGLDVPWPCMGKPSIIHVDNAKEFRGNTLAMACREYGIDLVFRPVKKPNYGGHIERLLGTLAKEIHALPGTTFSNPKEKGEYDSDRRAALTLTELDKWIGQLFLGAYHHRAHSGIGMSPLAKYMEGLMGADDSPMVGKVDLISDESKLKIDFLPLIERTIQSYGVSIDGVEYFADVLRRWVGATDPKSQKTKRKFVFRRDPRDISFVYFFDPDAYQYFRVPYRNTNHPAISLWELRAIQRKLAADGKKNADEGEVFRAYERMRQIEEAAKTDTRKARLQKARRKQHDQVRRTNAKPAPVIEPTESNTEFTDIQPFDEIERY